MNLVVLLKMVPDTVEELTIAADNKSLDSEFLRFKLGDPDEHALEQALLLKERHGGKVTVVTLEAPEADEALFTAMAKGADRAVKLTVSQTGLGTGAVAKTICAFLRAESSGLAGDTLLLPGAQATDDLEGELAPCLAEGLGLPYVGVVTGVNLAADGKHVVVVKELAGGRRCEFEVPLPAVLGMQAAEQPPRYVPVAKVRATRKAAAIDTVTVPPPATPRVVAVERMYKPEVASRAQMLAGTPDQVAEQIAGILAERGII
jgi:electron transfer flavoprotein beta subunit